MSQLLWFAWDAYYSEGKGLKNPDWFSWWDILFHNVFQILFLIAYLAYICGPFVSLYFAPRTRNTRLALSMYLIGACALGVLHVWAVTALWNAREWEGLWRLFYPIGLWLLAGFFGALGYSCQEPPHRATANP